MPEFLDRLNGSQLIGFCAVAGGLLMATIVTVASVVATQWRRVRVTELECALKQQMLDKGMSATEIEHVIRAGQSANGDVSVSGDEHIDRAALVQRMVDEGYEGEDIERVLKAYQAQPPESQEQAFAQKR